MNGFSVRPEVVMTRNMWIELLREASEQTRPFKRVDLMRRHAGANPTFPVYRYPTVQRTEIKDYDGNVIGYLETKR